MVAAEAIKRAFLFSCTPRGRGLSSDIDHVIVRGPLPSTSHVILMGSPSVTEIVDGDMVAEGGTVSRNQKRRYRYYMYTHGILLLTSWHNEPLVIIISQS